MKALRFSATTVALAAILWLAHESSVHAQPPGLTSTVQCDQTVVAVGTTFQCVMTLQNSGEVTLNGVNATAYLGECFKDGSCGFSLIFSALYYSAAEPMWTGRTLQYSNPYWDPLGSGALAPGEASSVTVTVSVFDPSRGPPPERQPEVCFGGSGISATDGAAIGPAADCVLITVVESLPATPSPTAPPPASPTPAPPSPVPEFPDAGTGPAERWQWPAGLVIAALFGATAGFGARLVALRRGLHK